MTAKDYKVGFGYGAKDGHYYGPNGIVGPYHKGNDRYTPERTPILIGSKVIGLTGSTGLVGGPHLHTQAGVDKACQNTFDPSPLDFKPGTVVVAGFGNQWGNYITLKVGKKYITYAHLNKIYVKVGDKIGEEIVMPTKDNIKDFYQKYFNKNPTANQYKKYQVKDGWRILARDLLDAKEAELRKCRKQGPESDNQALKDNLYGKIKKIFNK